MQTQNEKAFWLVAAAKAGVSQTQLFLNALWALTTDRKERQKIQEALDLLEKAKDVIKSLAYARS